jgi:hypothetical protein
MSTILDTHRLVVTSGEPRGQAFVLSEELTNIGRADDNQIVLSDPLVAAHHATLARRNDRYALYVPPGQSVAVDDAAAPVGQWVWLPNEASLALSPQTTLRLQPVGEDKAASDPAATPTKLGSTRRSASAKKGEKSARKTAKFVTDRAGATLVRFGEDGHLPELRLNDADAAPKSSAKPASGGNPAVLYAALGCSLLASVILLVVDLETSGSSQSKATARQAIVAEFIGQDGQPLKPYQRLLREASLAHSRGDLKAEHDAYRRVLLILNSEDRNPFAGVTGDLRDDERLRRYLGTLLGR